MREYYEYLRVLIIIQHYKQITTHYKYVYKALQTWESLCSFPFLSCPELSLHFIYFPYSSCLFLSLPFPFSVLFHSFFPSLEHLTSLSPLSCLVNSIKNGCWTSSVINFYAQASLLSHHTCVSDGGFLKPFSPEAEEMTKTNIGKKIWVGCLSRKNFLVVMR